MPATTFKMTTNIPVDLKLKYVDVWPNDPSKDPRGKGYGASIALTGEMDGETVRIYPKGFLNKNIAKLVFAGVVEDGHWEHDPAEKYSIPVKNGNIRIVNAKPAGEKYENFDILAVDGVDTSEVPSGKQPVSHSNVPTEKLPPLLRDTEETESRELHAKIAPSNGQPTNGDRRKAYREITEYVLKEIEPLYRKADLGLSDTAAAACIHTLFIDSKGRAA